MRLQILYPLFSRPSICSNFLVAVRSQLNDHELRFFAAERVSYVTVTFELHKKQVLAGHETPDLRPAGLKMVIILAVPPDIPFKDFFEKIFIISCL
ncbi:hypothetical protein [Methanothermobacter thermautotrophicus]|uniref:hypothetical protein n=1 Tax=Methanothermobacter thermautotrophicus TaxID=145262 RepID=UPI0011C05F6E|nr:hypothetical protein [Methanothermobacter thermautotrophicus]WBF08398.1 hypothetical protein ISG36_01415 [Methanothermobacter thermautotrophicus]